MKRLGQGPILADVRALRVLLGKCGLAQPSGWLPFTCYVSAPHNLTTSGVTAFMATLSRAMTVRSWSQAVYVSTTNDGSNYWTIELLEADYTSISSFDTSALSADNWHHEQNSNIGHALTVSDIMIRIRVTKTGSPGGIYLAAPAVFVT